MKEDRPNAKITVALITLILLTGISSAAQDPAIDRVQRMVRERIQADRGRDSVVLFGDDARMRRISRDIFRVEGTGAYRRDRYATNQRFTYEARIDTSNSEVRDLNYRILGLDRPESNNDRIIDMAERAVRQRIRDDKGRNSIVLFNDDARISPASRSDRRVSGSGLFMDNNDARRQHMTYQARVNVRDDRVSSVDYRIAGESNVTPQRFAFTQARRAVKQALRDEYGSGLNASFEGLTDYRVSNSETGVRGRGTFTDPRNGRRRRFEFDLVVNMRLGEVTNIKYLRK